MPLEAVSCLHPLSFKGLSRSMQHDLGGVWTYWYYQGNTKRMSQVPRLLHPDEGIKMRSAEADDKSSD